MSKNVGRPDKSPIVTLTEIADKIKNLSKDDREVYLDTLKEMARILRKLGPMTANKLIDILVKDAVKRSKRK